MAIDNYRTLAATVAADVRTTARARTELDLARSAAAGAAAQRADRRRLASEATTQLEHLALAAYTGESSEPAPLPASSATHAVSGASLGGPADVAAPPALAGAQQADDAKILLAVVVTDEEHVVARRVQAVRAVAEMAGHLQANVATAETSVAAVDSAVARTLSAEATMASIAVGSTPDTAAVLRLSPVTTSTGLTVTVGDVVADNSRAAPAAEPTPSILGPPVLSAAELSAWFTSAGHHANTTVGITALAADYLSAGVTTGVRGDLAFAQSLIETGNFDFPAGGQITAAANNFAGIGACDNCASGWRFPDAKTGVAAQEELLESYASPGRVATPLIGSVGVGGCCRTWISLAGRWATDVDYGVKILAAYKQMLDFVIPLRLREAGLGAVSSAARQTAPAA